MSPAALNFRLLRHHDRLRSLAVAPDDKRALHVRLSPDLIERLRNLAFWERETIPDVVERMLDAGITEAEQLRGSTYQERPAPVRRGRPPRRQP
mgnify:CR=1 FL=1